MSNGRLYYSKIKGVRLAKYLFDINSVTIERINIHLDDAVDVVGIKIRGCKKDGLEASFRCIVMNQAALDGFCDGIMKSASKHNVEAFREAFLNNNPFTAADSSIASQTSSKSLKRGFTRTLNLAEHHATVRAIKSG